MSETTKPITPAVNANPPVIDGPTTEKSSPDLTVSPSAANTEIVSPARTNDEIPVIDVEDYGASTLNNPLDANKHNIVAGGRFILGDFFVNAEGTVIGKINRVQPASKA